MRRRLDSRQAKLKSRIQPVVRVRFSRLLMLNEHSDFPNYFPNIGLLRRCVGRGNCKRVYAACAASLQ